MKRKMGKAMGMCGFAMNADEAPHVQAGPLADRRGTWVWLALLILFFTGLNALKPLHIDDTAFYFTARQIAHHPFDPYGFTIYWWQWPEPAIFALCNPVLPYWWAIAIRLFGDSPVMWKIWLLPFVAMFVLSLHRLFRRFAPGAELPLLFLIVLSPTFLPALNLMMDIPAVALGLTALCIAMRAVDKNSYGLAGVSGAVAGLAMETKYTAALFPAVIFLYALFNRRFILGIIPGIIAAGMFAAWEAAMYHRYGASQFFYYLNFKDSIKGLESKDLLWTSIPLLLGALIPMTALLGLAALDFSIWALAFGGAIIVAAFCAVAYAPVAVWSFFILGIAVVSALVISVYRLGKNADRDDLFLISYLLLELVGFVAVSPFAAARRAMGLVVIITLVIGRLARRRELFRRRPAVAYGIISASVLMGFGFGALDMREAYAQKLAIERASKIVNANRQPGQTVYFGAHWGLQFYAERLGYVAVIPDHSQLKKGDILLFPHPLIEAQRATIPADSVSEITSILVDDRVPLSTVPFYYGAGVPLQFRSRPRIILSIFRVTKDYIPETSYPASFMVDWALTRSRPFPPYSVRALLMLMEESNPPTAAKIRAAIVKYGPAEGINDALNDPDPAIREGARSILSAGR